MNFSKMFLMLFTLVIMGCASQGFNRGALQDQIGVKNPVVTDKEIKEVLDRKPNLPKPFKLAVYFKSPIKTGNAKRLNWSESDKNLILDLAKDLNDQNLVSQVFIILDSTVENQDLKSIRIAAAKHSADAVAIVDGAGEMDKYINNWGWTYIFILPAALVKGNEAEALFLTAVTMWDVRNEYLYLTAQAEGKAHRTQTALFGERDEVILDEAKTNSLKALKGQLMTMIKGIKK